MTDSSETASLESRRASLASLFAGRTAMPVSRSRRQRRRPDRVENRQHPQEHLREHRPQESLASSTPWHRPSRRRRPRPSRGDAEHRPQHRPQHPLEHPLEHHLKHHPQHRPAGAARRIEDYFRSEGVPGRWRWNGVLFFFWNDAVFFCFFFWRMAAGQKEKKTSFYPKKHTHTHKKKRFSRPIASEIRSKATPNEFKSELKIATSIRDALDSRFAKKEKAKSIHKFWRSRSTSRNGGKNERRKEKKNPKMKTKMKTKSKGSRAGRRSKDNGGG